MYIRKSLGPRMEPWGTPLAILMKISHSKPPEVIYYLKRRNKTKYMTWNFTRLKSVKKTSMPNPVIGLEYIKCYSWSSSRPVKSRSNSIRRSAVDPYWNPEKRSHFSRWSTILWFTSFSKTLLTTERRLTRQ